MRRAAAACLGACLLVSAPVLAQVDHLEVLEAPRLVDCDARPNFRIVINAVDASRRPVALNMTQQQALERFHVLEGDAERKVRYVGLVESGATVQRQGNYVLFLIDTSGSMNARLPQGETRFAAAKNAVRRSLANFADGVDHVAVVPFDSHNVVSRIRNATFQNSRQGVDQQIEAIPTPLRNNNTALYTAVLEALPILKQKAEAGFAVSLLVFTDGKNEVYLPGSTDDPGLLGDEGLARVKALAAESKIPIVAVGFGIEGKDRTENALRDVAWPSRDNYYESGDSGQRLAEVFEIARKKLLDRIQILYGPVRASRDELAGHSAVFRVRLRTAEGFASTSQEPKWDPPAIGVPTAETRCTREEAAVVLRTAPTDGPDASNLQPDLMKRLLILVGFGALLAVLWFAAPRFVWPEAYIPRPSFQIPQAPTVPGVQMGTIERPRAPSWQPPPAPPLPPAPPQPRPMPGAGPAAAPRGGMASDQTVFVPARPQGRPAPPPPVRPAPRASEPPPRRTADDETMFLPVDPNAKKGR